MPLSLYRCCTLTMHEFYSLYRSVVLHTSFKPNAAMSIEFPVCKSVALHYVLFAWRSVSDLAVVIGWVASGLVANRASKHIPYQGHRITESSRVLICDNFERIRGDMDVNIQCINIAIQSRHARTRDTCVVSSWPMTFLYTVTKLLISH